MVSKVFFHYSLQFLLKPETCAKYPGLQEEVLCFLKPVSYSRDKGRLTRKVISFCIVYFTAIARSCCSS